VVLFESMPMEESDKTGGELLPPNPIRVETALSRYPVHRLAKHGDIAIDIREENPDGEVSIKWEVDYGRKHGQPGPLAYKLDTLIINRRIEEAARPVPRVVRLGSLRDICRELGINEGQATQNIKKSLYQNSSTFITAKIRYRRNGGGERTLEAGFNRYQVAFAGEDLPDGRKADAVYIILNDIYIQVINGAMTRPLDYDYLKSLPPAPQRFYELLSYQVYAAIRNDRPRAKLLYSEFCTHAPQARHSDWERVRSQMNKIHRPHKESGYIARVDYQDTTDREGNPDWIMLYQPGPKARAEFRAFAKRGGPVTPEVEPFAADPAPGLDIPAPSPLEAELVGRGITGAVARRLVAEHGEDAIGSQLEILDWHAEKKPGKITDPAAWLVSAIKTGHAAPRGFVSRAERERRAEAGAAKEREAAEARRLKRGAAAAERAESDAISAYWRSRTKEQQEAIDAAWLARADPEQLAKETGPLKRMGRHIRRNEYIRALLRAEGKLPPLPTEAAMPRKSP
jgi:hypothetical protein